MTYHVTNTDNPVDFPKSALKHAKGNLLDLAETGNFDIVIQGCNCFNTMGGGIAREIRERYPQAASVDSMTVRGDYTKLGNWTAAPSSSRLADCKFHIINAYTQYQMSQGTDVFEYVAFQLILQKLVHVYGNQRIGLPYIGMGLAGGNKEIILNMITEFAHGVHAAGGTVTLVEFGG